MEKVQQPIIGGLAQAQGAYEAGDAAQNAAGGSGGQGDGKPEEDAVAYERGPEFADQGSPSNLKDHKKLFCLLIDHLRIDIVAAPDRISIRGVLVYRLGHGPLKAERRVRFPCALPSFI